MTTSGKAKKEGAETTMKKKKVISAVLAVSMLAAVILPGCGSDENSGKTEIEILQYKPEAATYFDQVEEQFNATHDDIHLTISSPNDASTIMRTRFVREDYPDIIGIGGDINYSYYVDADILADVSDYPGLSNIKQSYVDILEALEITPEQYRALMQGLEIVSRHPIQEVQPSDLL